MTLRIGALVVLLTTATIAGQVRHPLPLPDPAHDLVRVGVRLVTDATSASVKVNGALVTVGVIRNSS